MHARLTGAAIAALCLTAPAQGQDLFLVLYMGGTSPVSLVPADLDRTGCERAAAAEQAAFIARGDPVFTVRCERRGPNDMIWKLHPELAVK
jgi:hypothetical protein